MLCVCVGETFMCIKVLRITFFIVYKLYNNICTTKTASVLDFLHFAQSSHSTSDSGCGCCAAETPDDNTGYISQITWTTNLGTHAPPAMVFLHFLHFQIPTHFLFIAFWGGGGGTQTRLSFN